MVEFDIIYMTQNLIKGKVVLEHLVVCPTLIEEKLKCQFLNDRIMEIRRQGWKIYYDRAANRKGFGVGVLLISPNNLIHHWPSSYSLKRQIT